MRAKRKKSGAMKEIATLMLTCFISISFGYVYADDYSNNKQDYDHGDLLVSSEGRIGYVVEKEWSKLFDAYFITICNKRNKNDEDAIVTTQHSKRFEKLALPMPAFYFYDYVKHKKTGKIGFIAKRHQGFERWIYTVHLFKDDTRKIDPNEKHPVYEEWDEQDIISLEYPKRRNRNYDPMVKVKESSEKKN